MSDFSVSADKICQKNKKRASDNIYKNSDRFLRVADLVIAAGLLIILTPLIAIIAFLVWFQDRRSPVFRQIRLGRNGSRFNCLKFRTMTIDAEGSLQALKASDPDFAAEWFRRQKNRRDPRITGIGRILRQSSLDECLQLWNVLRGEMSLVGPRPIIAEEAYRYGRYLKEYCSVPPGITGLWQVSGRNDVTYRRRVALDVLYVRSRGLSRYLEILLRTIPAVLSGRGAY